MSEKPLRERSFEERMKDPSLSYYEKMYGQSEDDVRNALIHSMHKAKASRVEATFWGGHDEGGVQDLSIYDASGNLIEDDPPRSYDDELWAACDAVLSTKYYSWALGCSVEGTLYVDMKERRLWTESSIEEMVPERDPITWDL